MKQINKLLSLLLALLMVLSLAACGNSGGEAPEVAKELTLGSVNGNIYENAFFGIGLELDEDWTYATTEELASMVGLSADYVSDEEMQKSILEADMFYDMSAASNDGYCNMNVVVEHNEIYGSARFSLDETAEVTAEALQSALEDMGISIVSSEVSKEEFAGSEQVTTYLHGYFDEYDYDLYQKQILIVEGSYMVSITMTSYVEDNTEDMAGLFYPVD